MKSFFVESLTNTLLSTQFKSIDEIKHAIMKELEPYTLTERPLTEIANIEDTNKAIINALLVYKASKGVSAGTIKQYVIAINQLTDCVGKPLTQIQPDDIEYYLMLTRTKSSPSTVRNKYQCLSSIFSTLFNHGRIAFNPMLMVEPPMFTKNHKKPLTLREIEKIKMYCANDIKLTALVYLMLDTGCRVSEVTAIQLSDIDFDAKTILIRKGKGNKSRTVCFSDQTKIRLEEYLNTRTFNKPYLFCNDTRPYSNLKKETIEVFFRKMQEDLEMPRLTPHLMRHTCATTLIKRGLPIQDVAVYLGHADINTTTTYVYSDPNSIINQIQTSGGVA